MTTYAEIQIETRASAAADWRESIGNHAYLSDADATERIERLYCERKDSMGDLVRLVAIREDGSWDVVEVADDGYRVVA